MLAIASFFDPQADQRTQQIWAQLEKSCGLMGIKMIPIPHFSWQIAVEYDVVAASKALDQLMVEIQPFEIQTTGLALFTGPTPTLYLPIVKTRRLLELHETIWNRLLPCAKEPSPLYMPDQWVPHITLAYRDVNPDRLACALEELAFAPLSLTTVVDNLALAFQNDSQVGVHHRVELNQKKAIL